MVFGTMVTLCGSFYTLYLINISPEENDPVVFMKWFSHIRRTNFFIILLILLGIGVLYILLISLF